MSIEIIGTHNNVLVIMLSGRLKQSELAELQRSMAEKVGKQEKIGVLVVATAFEGWDKSSRWGDDLEQQFAMDPLIRKMAIVGDKNWEDLAITFTGKGLRRFPIEYFTPTEIAQATAWVENE
ncbi:MAG: STAS/SEC14 domain-containing protein [Planctomycetaceae bacterium]|nr:MAG: STAS/SEC14 domain-containing protein [Planctomycetaceae bacterium]